MISFEVAEDEVVRRLSGRRICRQCQTPYHIEFDPPKQDGVCDRCGGELYQRDDDKPETVRNRLRVYLEQTAPLVEHYRKAGVLHTVDAMGDIDTVTDRLKAVIHGLDG